MQHQVENKQNLTLSSDFRQHHVSFFFVDEKEKSGFFLTETKPATESKTLNVPQKTDGTEPDHPERVDSAEQRPPTAGERGHLWDEYLLSILSRPTAQWIVTQKTDPANQRYKVRFF